MQDLRLSQRLSKMFTHESVFSRSLGRMHRFFKATVIYEITNTLNCITSITDYVLLQIGLTVAENSIVRRL